MSERSNCSIYVGNFDDKVNDRVLYDILIQAGRVVDLHIPRDKESGKHRGFAFAEYENEEIAAYAVKLFSGLVTLHNRTLKFAVSGQDKPSPINSTNMSHKSRLQPASGYSTELSQYSNLLSPSCRLSAYPENHRQEAPVSLGVTNQSNGYGSHLGSYNNEYSQRYFGPTLDSFNRSRSGRYEMSNPISYPFY